MKRTSKAKGGELKIGNDYELSAFIERRSAKKAYSPPPSSEKSDGWG
ncbi:MAG: hypothetical protein ACLR1P_07790 [Oscillospiraceae bacterium]